jgi:FAD binding domain
LTESTGTAAAATRVSAEADRIPVWNWTREQVSYPCAEIEVHSVDEIRQILGDPERYPSPVRGLASRHSTTRCGEADGGTVVDVRGLNRILDIGADSVTAEPGALYIDVARELERRGLQFHVNIELGNLSLGAAAICATKDASMPGEFGQVNSYAVGMKVLTPSGEIVEITEDDPGLLQAARSCYGLFGIVVEVTFRVRPLQAMAVYHEVFKLDDFIGRLPELVARGESMMLYLFPYLGQIMVEFRRYTGTEDAATSRSRHFGWRVRNFAWSKGVPTFANLAERYIPSRRLRYGAVNAVNRLAVPAMMRRIVSYGHTIPTDQMIRYPLEAGRSKYTFSIWAFPEEWYGETLREYFRFANDYYRRVGWRPNMTHVGYRIAQDQSSLFSYTHEGTALTIDPVCTGAPGWNDFLDAYNTFCSDHGGSPLLNQTPRLTPDQVRRAFGERIDRFQEYRRRFDRHDRLLSGYFRELLR